MRRSQTGTKALVSAFIVGVFILYSLIRGHSNVAALPPPGANARSTATTAPASPTTGDGSATSTATTAPGARYKNGSYLGSVTDAQWGNIQVKAVITGGKLTDVQFVQYPNERSRSVQINSYADPQLKQEAIQAQSAQVDVVSGATDTSEAFMQSLADALSQAQA